MIIDSTGQKMGQHEIEYNENDQEDYLNVLELDPNAPNQVPNNKIVVPYNQVLSYEDSSFKQGITGLQVEAAFQLETESNTQFLCLRMNNQTGKDFNDLMIKFQANSYSLNPKSQDLPIMTIQNGVGEIETKVELDMKGQTNGQPPDYPIKIKIALNTQLDIFVFEVPCSFTVFLRKFDEPINEEGFKGFIMNEQGIKTKNTMECEDINAIISEIDTLISKLENNNIGLVFRQSRGNGEMLNCISSTVDGLPIVIQIYLPLNSDQIMMNYVVVEESLVPLVFQAIKFIISL